MKGRRPRYPREQRQRNLPKFDTKNRRGRDLPFRHFSDEKCYRAGLAVFAFRGLRALKQKHRSAFQIPTRSKAVYFAPLIQNLKAPKRVLLNFRRGRDLNPRYLAVYRFSRPAVSTTHTPLLRLKLYKIKSPILSNRAFNQFSKLNNF